MRPIGDRDFLSIEQRVAEGIALLARVAETPGPVLVGFVPLVLEVIGEGNPVSKGILEQFTDKIEHLDNDTILPVLDNAFNALRSNAFFGKEAFRIGFLLSEVFQAQEDFREAARVLALIDVDKPQISALERLTVVVTGAEFCLSFEDIVGANKFLKKLQKGSYSLGDSFDSSAHVDEHLLLRYRAAYARTLDAERRFLEAARRYMELASGLPSETDRISSLEKAVTCVILSKSSKGRDKMLSILYQDPRSQRLANYRILEIMVQEKFISSEDTRNFESMLSDTQNVLVEGGITLLQRCVREHNLIAASRVYSSIAISELANILDVTPEAAEKIAGKMIQEGRVQGSIDQIDSFVDFEQKDSSSLYKWDMEIFSLCSSVNSVVNQIISTYPSYAP